MSVLIETYRGWEISFNTSTESFYVYSGHYDHEDNKKSFSAAKKFIDDFIKENQNFKPFLVQTSPDSYKSKNILRIVGIRKDGIFVYETQSGGKKQLSKYDEKDYIIYDPDNDKYWEQVKDLEKEKSLLDAQIKELKAKITGVSLIHYKESLLKYL